MDFVKYRPCVGIILLDSYNRIFVGRKPSNSFSFIDNWQLPQGGIEDGEHFFDAMKRELFEETGIFFEDVSFIAEQDKDWIFYNIPFHEFELKDDRYKDKKYLGQRQKWFLLKAKDNVKINLDSTNTGNPEFCEYKWINPIEIFDIGVSFKKDIYRQVFTMFNKYIS